MRFGKAVWGTCWHERGNAMEFEQLTRADNEETGAIKVGIALAPETVEAVLGEFYEVVGAHKGAGADASWDEIDEVAMKTMTAESYKELRRDFVVNMASGEAMKALGIVPELTPRVHVLEYPDPSRAYYFDLSVVERPRVSLSSYDPVEIETEDLVLSDELIDGRIASLLEHHAEYAVGEARPIVFGDCVKIDVATMLNGKTVPRLTGKGMILELADRSMPDTFVEKLLGMGVGETKTFDYGVRRDRAISDSDVDVYTATVTVVAQLTKRVPLLTDEWVDANIEKASTVEEFRAGVAEMLESEIAHANRDTHARLANIELAKRIEGKIPDELFQASRDGLMRRLERELSEKGQSIDDYYEENEMNEEELSVQMLIKSGENLRQGFALEALFDGRGMALSDDDLAYACREVFGNGACSVEDLKASGKYAVVERSAKRMVALNWLADTSLVKSGC